VNFLRRGTAIEISFICNNDSSLSVSTPLISALETPFLGWMVNPSSSFRFFEDGSEAEGSKSSRRSDTKLEISLKSSIQAGAAENGQPSANISNVF
jgi:hypothetical protein